MTHSNPEEALSHLERLAQKPGVQSTLILSRHSGAIVRVSGLLAPPQAPEAEPEADEPSSAAAFAALAFEYIEVSTKLVRALDADDDARLLRVRTRRHEIVMVPDQNFILVLVHETPPA